MSEEKGAPVYHPLKPLIEHRDEAKQKALKSLSAYKFILFGYWAGIWVHLNKCVAEQDPNLKSPSPFRSIVKAAREEMKHEIP